MELNENKTAPTTSTNVSNDKFSGVLEAQTALNKNGLIEKKDVVIVTGKGFEDSIIDEMLAKIPTDARFSGSQQSNSLPADISEPFNIEVADNVVLAYKLAKNVTIADKENKILRTSPIESTNASLKIPVKATIKGETYSANVIVNRENVAEVKELLRNQKAMATTSHWGQIAPDGNDSKVLKKQSDNSYVARLVLVPINATNETTKVDTNEMILTNEPT